jgi:hypothetical protein
MTVPPAPPPIGPNKAIVSVVLGTLITVIVFILNQYLKTPIPAELSSALQTAAITAAVYYTPHGGTS